MKKAQYLLLIIIILMCIAPKAIASSHSDSTFTVSFKDSLVYTRQNKILYNNIFINNVSVDTITVNASINIPKGWKCLGGNLGNVAIIVPPHSIRGIAVNLMKVANVPSIWQNVDFKIWNSVDLDTQSYFYSIKAAAESGFRVDQSVQDITLIDRPEVLHLGVHLKNTGNVDGVYNLLWSNYNLNINVAEKITLPAGRDTTYYYPLKLSNAQWNKLYKETIRLKVAANNSNSYVEYKVSRPQSLLKQNESAYNNFPISVEGSAVMYGDKFMYSYGGKGVFQFGDDILSVYYRSKQLGATQNLIQRNVFIADYVHKHWRLQAGQTSICDNFIAIGNGFRLTYVNGEKKEYGIAAVLHDPAMSIFQSDGIQAKAKYQVDKFLVTNTAEVNIDKLNKINGYVSSNSVQIVKKENISLDAQLGAGLEENKSDVNNQTLKGSLSLGYNFFYKIGKFDFGSNVDYHGKNFPGYKKGLNMQAHSVDYHIGKAHVGLLYTISDLRRNYFKDTLFNTDLLRYNTSKYGVTAGYNSSRTNFNVSSGIMKQNGFSNMFNTSKYYYTDINYEQKLDKTGISKLTFVSQNAFSNSLSSLVTSDALFANVKFFGVSGAYVRTPLYSSDANGSTIAAYSETFNGGPFVNYSLFRKTLRGTFKYMFYRTLKDNLTRTGLEANLVYNTLKTGTYIQFTGYLPLRDDNQINGLPIGQTRYGILSVSQTLKVPVITHRKYYDLKVVVYYDANSNNIKDKDEKTLGAMNMGINDEIMMTDENGVVDYENIKEGSYKLDLINSKSEDLVPVDGPIQSITINNNTTYQVPFKKGRAINGNIKIISDAYSNTKYGAGMIEVSAEDSTGHKYKTFTDENGNFNLFVSEGIYNVYINEASFADTDFKPARASYTIDLYSHENSYVVFEIKQKKRKIRFLNQ